MSASRPPSGEAERFAPEGHGPLIRYEHLHRYALACRAVAGRSVLDLGCGSGYGSRLLRAAGARVVSVDLDRLAAHCPPSARARGEQLPFRDRSFDAVVCFETLEHLADPGALVREVARVLERDGFALLSTPDRSLYSGRAGNRNPYHLAELERPELSALLSESFGAFALYGQSVWAGSWIARLDAEGAPAGAGTRELALLEAPPLEGQSAAPAPWTATGDARAPAPLYLVAACARTRAGLRRLEKALGPESLLHDAAQRLIGDYLAALADVARRDQELLAFEKHCSSLEALLSEQEAAAAGHRAHAENLEREIAGLREHARNLGRRLEEESGAGAGHRAHAENLERLLAAATEEESALRAHAQNLERLAAEWESTAEGHRTHARNLEDGLREREARIAGLGEHAQNLERLAADREAVAEGHRAHGENLERVLREREAQIAGLGEHAQNLERLVAEREAVAQGHRSHAENLGAALAERERELAQLQSENAELRREGEELRRERAERDRALRAEATERERTLREGGAALARELREASETLERIRATRWFRLLQRAGVFER
jgi:SAM-dependent methyltransferase